jgi:NRPS condensation-like uncharacterized protein
VEVHDATVQDPVSQQLLATPVDLAFHDCREWAVMVIGLECTFGGRLDRDTLAQASALLVETEPMLGHRLVADAEIPYWEPVPRADWRLLTVVSAREDYEAAYHAGFDASAGPQLALCLWPRDEGDRLLVRMTHLVGDGAALQLLAARLASLYSALAADPGHRPEPGRLPPRDAGQLIAALPRATRLRAVLGFAWFMAPRVLPRRTHHLPLPKESDGPWVPVVRHLPAPRLAVLSSYGRRRRATVNDLFLAAAYRALAAQGWDGEAGLRIAITVDMRRWCLPPAYEATISNLASWEYPYLVRDLGASFDDTLARISAVMRRRKRSRPGLALAVIGHRLLKKMPKQVAGLDDDRKAGTAGEAGKRSLSFSNEGALDVAGLRFAGEKPLRAHIVPPFIGLPHVHVCLTGYDGALTIASVTPRNGAAVVEAFLDALVSELPGEDGDPESAGESAGRDVAPREARLH